MHWRLGLVISILFVSPALAVADEWVKFRHDLANTGFTSDAVAQPLDLKWKYYAGNAFSASPAVADDTIYIGAADGNFYAFNSSDGSVKWNFKGRGDFSSAAVFNKTIYVSCEDGNFYALDAGKGEVKWKRDIGNKFFTDYLSSPAVSEGRVYVGSYNGNAYALDAATGAIVWSYLTGGPIVSSPAVVSGILYIGSADGSIYAFDAAAGELKWKHQTEKWVISTPSVYNSTVYIGSNDNNVYALDAESGALKWRYITRGKVRSSPAVGDGTVYVGSDDSYLYALDADTGALKWKQHTGAAIRSSPAVTDRAVYFGFWMDIYSLDKLTGERTWKSQIGRWITSSPAIYDGDVYIGSNDGYVYAFTLHKPKIVLIANSIDYARASEFLSFLRKNFNVVYSLPGDYKKYKYEKLIAILGGPNAPEGTGEIVKEILSESEQAHLSIAGNREMFLKRNPWGGDQTVFVIAGSDRSQTKLAEDENKEQLLLQY